MSDQKTLVFKTLNIVAWIIFVGLSIETGGLLVNFVFTQINPEFVGNLYQKLDLRTLYTASKSMFFLMYGLIISISLLKVMMFYIVVRLVTKLDLSKPFNSFVAKQITLVSYFTFFTGLASYVAREVAHALQENNYFETDLSSFWSDSQAFILMAAVIYIIASIFNKGVELQEENDLTV